MRKLTLPLILLPIVCSSQVCRRREPKHPHLIFVVADDLGYGDVGFMGSGASYVQTPTLNKLATSGSVLTQYYVQPTCSPTRAALLTGKASFHTGVSLVCCAPYTMMALPRGRRRRKTATHRTPNSTDNFGFEDGDDRDVFFHHPFSGHHNNTTENEIAENIPLLPELLVPFNYTSHAVGKWHLGMHSHWALPTRRGFESFFGFFDGASDHFSHSHGGFQDLHFDTVEASQTDLNADSSHNLRHEPKLPAGLHFVDRAVDLTDTNLMELATGLQSQDHQSLYSTHLYTRRAQHVIRQFARGSGLTTRKVSSVDGTSNQENAAASSDGCSNKSLFLYLAYQAIHSPLQVPQSYSDQYHHLFQQMSADAGDQLARAPVAVWDQRKKVLGMISALDEGIHNVTQSLREEGLWKDCIFIFTSDNGAATNGLNNNMGSNFPLRGTKRTMFEGGLRVPAFMTAGSSRFLPQALIRRHHTGLFHAMDWVPSILGLVSNPSWYFHKFAERHSVCRSLAADGFRLQSGLDCEEAFLQHLGRPARELVWKDWSEAIPVARKDIWIGLDGTDAWRSFFHSKGTYSRSEPLEIEISEQGRVADSRGVQDPNSFCRQEIIFEVHPQQEDAECEGHGEAIRMGDMKLILRRGKHWTHSHQLGQRYAAGMGLHFARQAFLDNVSAFNPQTEIRPKVFEVDCGEESTHLGHPCDTESFPCLFNITADPCELYDLSHDPAYREVLDDLTSRILQQRAVAPLEKAIQSDPCRSANPSPRRHLEFNNTWMPFCPTADPGWDLSHLETPAEKLSQSQSLLQAGNWIQGVQLLRQVLANAGEGTDEHTLALHLAQQVQQFTNHRV